MQVPSFDDLLRRLREMPAGESGTGVDEQEVAEAERELGVSFPPGFRSFLREIGWLAAVETEVFGLGEEISPRMNVRTITAEMRGQGLPSSAVAIARDTAGAVYCLDASYSGPYESPVYRWQPAEATESPLEYVGHDFSSWLWMRLASGD